MLLTADGAISPGIPIWGRSTPDKRIVHRRSHNAVQLVQDAVVSAAGFADRPSPLQVARMPRLLTDVVRACRGVDQHAAVIHHLLALIEGAGHQVDRSLPVNRTLAWFAFDVAGRRVKREPAPWMRPDSILRRRELLAEDDSAAGVRPRRWSQLYRLPDDSGDLIVTTEASWLVVSRAGDDAHHRRTTWAWIQTCNERVIDSKEPLPFDFPEDAAGYEGPLPMFPGEREWLTAAANDESWLDHFKRVLR